MFDGLSTNPSLRSGYDISRMCRMDGGGTQSRGGFSTKIHLKTDFSGLPIAFHLTAGEASDGRNFKTLLDIGPDINPRAALGDKGYDSKSNREAARQRGICPAIPYRSNTRDMPAFFPKVLYKGRARIEQAVSKLKR
jgi:transposase